MAHSQLESFTVHVRDEPAVGRSHQASSTSAAEVEDRYLAVRDDNVRLKKQLHDQEEKIKQLTTKLVRISQDAKRTSEYPSRGYFRQHIMLADI